MSSDSFTLSAYHKRQEKETHYQTNAILAFYIVHCSQQTTLLASLHSDRKFLAVQLSNLGSICKDPGCRPAKPGGTTSS